MKLATRLGYESVCDRGMERQPKVAFPVFQGGVKQGRFSPRTWAIEEKFVAGRPALGIGLSSIRSALTIESALCAQGLAPG